MSRNNESPDKNTFSEEESAYVDALSAGVKDGLHTRDSIRLLVSYLVKTFSGEVTRDLLIEMLSQGGFVNYFEAGAAIDDLLSRGVLLENEQQMLELPDRLVEQVELLEGELPHSVVKKSTAICHRYIARAVNEKENLAVITETERGYEVQLAVRDGDFEFLHITLYAPTLHQAELMKRSFINNPVQVYDTLTDSILQNDDDI